MTYARACKWTCRGVTSWECASTWTLLPHPTPPLRDVTHLQRSMMYVRTCKWTCRGVTSWECASTWTLLPHPTPPHRTPPQGTYIEMPKPLGRFSTRRLKQPSYLEDICIYWYFSSSAVIPVFLQTLPLYGTKYVQIPTKTMGSGGWGKAPPPRSTMIHSPPVEILGGSWRL